jgi:MFS family permease
MLLKGFLSVRLLTFLLLADLVWHRASFELFGIVYVISAFLGAALFPLMDTMLADITPIERRTEVYGILRAVANAGWAFGPAIGGFVVASGMYHRMFLASAAVLLIATVVAFWKIGETRQAPVETGTQPTRTTILQDGQMIRFLAICMIMFLVKGQLIATLSVHASGNVGLSKPQIGWLYFQNAAMVATMLIFVSRWLRHVNPLKAMIAASVVYAAGYFLVGQATGMISMIFAMAVITSAEMLEAPTAAAHVSRLAPTGKTGIYMGALNLTMHLGWTTGPLLGGILLDNLAAPVQMWNTVAAMAICAALGFAMLLYISGRKGNR